MKQILILIVSSLIPMSTQGQEAIIKTYNYYTWNPNLEDIETYKSISGKSVGENWSIVTNGKTQEKAIINAARFEVFDHSIFTYFKDYKKFTPEDCQELFYSQVLSNRDELNPILVLEFLQYLEKYLKTEFPNKEYYFTILDKETMNFYINPSRLNINGVMTKISTVHSTFTDPNLVSNFEELRSNKDKAELTIEEGESRDNWKTEWIPIEDNYELKTDSKTLIFKKIFYSELLEKRFIELYEVCRIAIELNLKIKRNTDWLI